MSTIEKGVSKVPGSYFATAQQHLEELHRWRDQIPRFVIPPTADATQKLSGVAAIPVVFIEQTNVALETHRALVRMDGATPDQIRDLVAYATAYGPLVHELEAVAQFLHHSVTAALNQAATEALTTYSLAQRLAKQPATAELAPYVADMRRALGRTRKSSPEERAKKAAKAAPPEAEPDPS